MVHFLNLNLIFLDIILNIQRLEMKKNYLLFNSNLNYNKKEQAKNELMQVNNNRRNQDKASATPLDLVLAAISASNPLVDYNQIKNTINSKSSSSLSSVSSALSSNPISPKENENLINETSPNLISNYEQD